MTAQITQVIDALPTNPDPATDTNVTFSEKAAASVLAQRNLPPQINEFGTQINAVATEANNNAVSAALSATQAANSASSAAAVSGAAAWVSGGTYTAGSSTVWSLLNFLTYRCTLNTTGADVTDPRDDSGHWVAMTQIKSWLRKTANYTCASGENVRCSTTAGGWTLKLPLSPADGDEVTILDVDGTFNVNPLTLDPNGKTAMGFSPFSLNIQYFKKTFVFDATLNDWRW